MTPLELMERLAANLPRPRVHLTRFSGVFAPHYKYRHLGVLRPNAEAQSSGPQDSDKPLGPRIHWAQLLKRVFNIDVEKCHLCGGHTKLIASIEDPLVIKKILVHLGLPYPAPTPWPARGPPENDDLNQQTFNELT